MSYYTTDVYEIKREITIFSSKISKNLKKATSNFVLDMQYGIARKTSVLTTEIARALDEGIKLKNTSERLCDNMENIEEDEIETIKNNYYAIIRENVFIDKDDKVVVLFDDSEIAKPYGKKFEDLCRVRDASQPKTTLVTIKSLDAMKTILKHPISGIFDRGYDSNTFFKYFGSITFPME